jgi:hypothetical protein
MLKFESNDIKITCGLNFQFKQIQLFYHRFELYDKTINS